MIYAANLLSFYDEHEHVRGGVGGVRFLPARRETREFAFVDTAVEGQEFVEVVLIAISS